MPCIKYLEYLETWRPGHFQFEAIKAKAVTPDPQRIQTVGRAVAVQLSSHVSQKKKVGTFQQRWHFFAFPTFHDARQLAILFLFSSPTPVFFTYHDFPIAQLHL